MGCQMHKPRRRLPKGIHVHESGSVYICYKNEQGKIIRENTHQTDVRAAELMLAQARTDVAMKTRFTSLSFESVKFIDLFNDWWNNHGSRTRSKFEYRTPRVLSRFDKKRKRARSIPMQSAASWQISEGKDSPHRASTSAGRFFAAFSTMPFASKNTTRTR